MLIRVISANNGMASPITAANDSWPAFRCACGQFDGSTPDRSANYPHRGLSPRRFPACITVRFLPSPCRPRSAAAGHGRRPPHAQPASCTPPATAVTAGVGCPVVGGWALRMPQTQIKPRHGVPCRGVCRVWIVDRKERGWRRCQVVRDCPTSMHPIALPDRLHDYDCVALSPLLWSR